MSALSIWVPWTALAGSLVCLAGVLAVLIRSPWRALAVRVGELERAFPAWQSELAHLAGIATEEYARARAERERVQGWMGGQASGRARRESPEEQRAAELAALPPEERKRQEREAAKEAVRRRLAGH